MTVEGYLLKQFFQCWIKTVISEWQYWTLNVLLNMMGLRLELSPINRIIRNTFFFYLGWCPWTPKERFFEKNFCCKSSLWPHYLFQYRLSQNTTERQHAKILSFSHKRKIGVKSRRYLTISKKRRSGFKFWNLSSPVWLNMVNYKKKLELDFWYSVLVIKRWIFGGLSHSVIRLWPPANEKHSNLFWSLDITEFV